VTVLSHRDGSLSYLGALFPGDSLTKHGTLTSSGSLGTGSICAVLSSQADAFLHNGALSLLDSLAINGALALDDSLAVVGALHLLDSLTGRRCSLGLRLAHW
jgi:hypothetical protein